MRLLALLTLAFLLFAGCADDAEPVSDGPDGVVEAPAATFAGVSYRCPGRSMGSETPCGGWSPAFANVALIDVALRAEPPLIAMVGTSLASGVVGTVAPAEPGMALLTSTDKGSTWAAWPLPSVADDANSRTGRASPYWAGIEFTPDGALHVLMQVQGDIERNVIGGEVPDPLQSNNDIAFASSLDDGRSWTEPTLLSDLPASSYSLSLSLLADGTLFATWTDYPAHDFLTAWSQDGATWTFGAPVRADCRNPTPAIEFLGHVLTACQDDLNFMDSSGDVMILSTDRATATVTELDIMVGEEPASEDDQAEGFPGCGALQLHIDADRLLLVLSRCPTIELFASTDALHWMALASVDPADLGLAEGWGSEGLWVDASAVDSTGALHLILSADRVWPTAAAGCTCIETRVSHDVLDTDGTLLHDVELHTWTYDDPASQATIGTNALSLSSPEIGFNRGEGWMLWRNGLTQFGWFDVETS